MILLLFIVILFCLAAGVYSLVRMADAPRTFFSTAPWAQRARFFLAWAGLLSIADVGLIVWNFFK